MAEIVGHVAFQSHNKFVDKDVISTLWSNDAVK